ncbi:MAG: class I SAM-dependent methyltransferase [Hyphomonadaceae bacterium]
MREKLIRQIEHTGPLTVAQFMAAALYDPEHGYYVNEPNIGEAGDFITAPEVSQMFGELIGLWRAHEWETIGKPDPIQLIELGPGRGTLAADARRAARIAPDFNAAARYAFIESNAAFQKMQRDAMAPDGVWHVALNEIPEGPSLIVANEFFDCLPIRQFIRKGGAWRERLIGAGESGLAFGLAREAVALASLPRDVEEGAIYELAPALQTWVEQIAARITQHKGRALIIDYAGDGWGDTLQSMRAHKRISPLEAPGESDLTAHVDFAAMARLAEAAGLAVHGPVAQGAWLKALGVEARAARLVRDNPDQAENIARDLHRLTDEAEMGVLFQVLCLSHPALPAPAGF